MTTAEASAFEPDQWATDQRAIVLAGVTVSVDGPASAASYGGQVVVTSNGCGTGEGDGLITVRLDVPLGDAAGYWHPDAGWERTLPADWSAWRVTSLVRSAPIGCLYDSAGRGLLGYAADRLVEETRVRFGVSEERKRFGVWLRFPLAAGRTVRLRLATPGTTVAAALRELRGWLHSDAGVAPLPVPDFGRTPVYSTWYAFTQDVNAADVEREAALAAELGFGQLFLDDGWQLHGNGRGYSGCGDWEPDPAKFPDFTGHVAAVRALGLRCTAWIAPLLLGERATAFRRLARFAPVRVPHLGCRILDPRHREVREHVVAVCRRLVAKHGLDGLKIDFLDEAMAYSGSSHVADAEDVAADAAAGHVPDVGRALALLLGEVRDALQALRGEEFVIELRQPYTGPAMTAFGNLLRASDCPADPVANRVRTLDIALAAPGGAVHSDPLMWDPGATPATVARHLHGALHAVPQVSTRLGELSPAHRETLAFWLAAWRRLRPELTGDFEPGRPDQLFPQVTAGDGEVLVVTAHTGEPIVLPPGPWQELTVVNATPAGRVLIDCAATTQHLTVAATTFDAQGRPGPASSLALTAGLHAVPVPPSGLLRLTPSAR